MNVSLILAQTVLLVILIVDYRFINQVNAERKVISVGNWFGSYEKSNLQNAEGKENIALDTTEPTGIKFHYKKKLKKGKNKLKFLKKDIDWVADDDSAEVVKKTKKRRKKLNGRSRKFQKDNATSDSEEQDKRRKPPVDIIVHIKMNE